MPYIRFGMEDFVVQLSPEEAKVQEAIEALLDSEGYELIKIKLKRSQTKSMLALYIDTKAKENGVVMENLQDISHLVSDVLDASFNESSLLQARYDLEVSSPGLDRPLSKRSHFANAVGKQVKIRLKVPNEQGLRNILGNLSTVDEDKALVLLPSKDVIVVNFSDIADANVVFDFAEIDKNKKKVLKK